MGASGVPSREPFWEWLHRSLDQERGRKTAGVGPISERHYRALEDVRYELLARRKITRHGYSRQLVSRSTLLEVGVELLYAHVFGRRMP